MSFCGLVASPLTFFGGWIIDVFANHPLTDYEPPLVVDLPAVVSSLYGDNLTMKKPAIFFGALLSLTLVVIFGRDYVKGKVEHSNSKAEQPFVTSQANPKVPPPPHIVYHMMFRHIVWLQRKGDQLQADGENGAIYKNRYQVFAGLTNQETDLLNRTAIETVDRVKQFDSQITALVKADREARKDQYNGKPIPNTPPPLNPEVTRLDTARKSVIMGGYEKLREGFGWRFVDFEKFVQEELTSKIQDASGIQRIPYDAPRGTNGALQGRRYQ